MRLARYHCRKPDEPAFIDRKLPGPLQRAPRQSRQILARAVRRDARRDARRILLRERRPRRQERSAALHPEVRRHDAHRVPVSRSGQTRRAGPVCCRSPRSPTSRRRKSPPPGHDRMIINLKPEHLDAWLIARRAGRWTNCRRSSATGRRRTTNTKSWLRSAAGSGLGGHRCRCGRGCRGRTHGRALLHDVRLHRREQRHHPVLHVIRHAVPSRTRCRDLRRAH